MSATHIRLSRSDREDATALIIPIEGTIFEVTVDYETIAITKTGRIYRVNESIPDIGNALGDYLLRVDHT